MVLINSAVTHHAQAEGLLAPIDPTKIANFADLDPSLTAKQDLDPGGALYGLRWTRGLISIAVNKGDFPTAPASVADLWDPALRGRVSIRHDAVQAVQIAALATGQNINDITDLDAAKAKLTELLSHITTFWGSENDWNQ